jgi:sugar-specific transcriptional regulator TrmB
MRTLLLEKIGIGFSVIGTTISLAVGQPAYSTIPITATLGINYINRRKEIRDLDETEISTREMVEDIKSLLPKNNVKISSQTEDNLPKSQISSLEKHVEEIENNLNQIKAQVENDYYNKLQTIANQLEYLSANNDYTYELIRGRRESREVLFEALDYAEHELIIVCPWLGYGFNNNVIKRCEKLLDIGITIKIGWGKNTDIDSNKLNDGYNINSNEIDDLRSRTSGKLYSKLLGTHEKFLVCDRKFAMLGSHNFLTSTNQERERELGIKTNDPRMIDQLINRYNKARDIQNSHNDKNRQEYKEDFVDDIPF